MVDIKRILDLEDIQEEEPSPDELLALEIAEKEIDKGEIQSWKKIKGNLLDLGINLEQTEEEEPSPDELLALKIAENEIAKDDVKSWKKIRRDLD